MDSVPLFAAPGETAAGSVVIPQPGEYFAICFVPRGTTSMQPPASPGVAHAMLGMMQAFTATEAGTEVGPLPPAGPTGSAAP